MRCCLKSFIYCTTAGGINKERIFFFVITAKRSGAFVCKFTKKNSRPERQLFHSIQNARKHYSASIFFA